MRLPEVSVLPNGLRVITDRNDNVASAAVGVWVDVGTRHEPEALNGVAHLLEHMAFKGTTLRSARAIAEEIENVGGHLNAYTSREQTAYYARVLGEDVPRAVELLSDILQHSAFDAVELDRERTVILQEIGQAADTPDDLIFDQFQEIAFPSQGIGRPVLGRPEIIQTIPREEISGYMRQHYGAGGMVVSAAGAVDHADMVDLAGRWFTELPALSRAAPEPAQYAGGDRRERRKLEQIHLVLGFEGVEFASPDYYATQILSALLGGGMSSRLFQEIREKRGLVYSIYAFASSFNDGGLFGIYAGTGTGEIKELLPVLCDELSKVADHLTDEEVVRARTQLKASLLMGLESTSARVEHNATQLLLYGRPIGQAELIALIDAVDTAAVRRVARRTFTSPPTFTCLGPVGRVEPFERLVERLKP